MEKVINAGSPQSNGHQSQTQPSPKPDSPNAKLSIPITKDNTPTPHTKTPSDSYSLDLDADPIDKQKSNHDERIARKKTELEEEANRLAKLQNDALDAQVTRQC